MKINEAGNFFKHGDRDPKECLEFNPKQTEFYIFIAIQQYEAATQDQIFLFGIYKAWFLIKNPKLISQIMPELEAIAKQHFSANPQEFWKQILPLILYLEEQI